MTDKTMNYNMLPMQDLIIDDTELDLQKLHPCPALSLEDLINNKIIASPDTHCLLQLDQSERFLINNTERFELVSGIPKMYPKGVHQDVIRGIAENHITNALNQYVYLSTIKQSGEINASSSSTAYRRSQWRTSKNALNFSGITVDIGGGNPSISRCLFTGTCQYVSIDPYLGDGEFRIIGMGEKLPIRTDSVDNVVYNTSLDHILDYCTALDEAARILKPGGIVLINTYAWLSKATLLTDTVHFHHFREFQILEYLKFNFRITNVSRYECPKKDSHRFTLVVQAKRK